VRHVQRVEAAEHLLPEPLIAIGTAPDSVKYSRPRGRRLMVDGHPRRDVELAHPPRVEDPDVHERHDEPAARVAAEEPLRVLHEVLVAELPPTPGKTGMPSQVIGDPSSP
jgi:hypothetical protein